MQHFVDRSLDNLSDAQIAWIKMHIKPFANNADGVYNGGFEWEIILDGGRLLHISAECGGSVGAVIAFFQEYLRAWPWKHPLTFIWASLDPDICTGGAAIITPKSVKYLDINEWLSKEMRKAEQRRQRINK